MQPVSVCYSGNKRIFPGLLLSVLSLAKFTERPLHVYVLSMDMHELDPSFVPFSGNQINILDGVLKEKNPESRAELIDVTEVFRAELAKGKNMKNHYTPYTLLRLYMDGFEHFPDKIIYLDIDTMCAKDIAPLFDTDIEGHEYAACVDPICKIWIDRHYCNAGVLLLNMPEIRQSKLFERARQLMCERRYAMPDQTALHKLGRRRIYLPRKYNEQSRRLREDTVIKHFCQGIKFYLILPLPLNIKQWQRERVHKKLKIFIFDDIYAEYDRLAQEFDLKS